MAKEPIEMKELELTEQKQLQEAILESLRDESVDSHLVSQLQKLSISSSEELKAIEEKVKKEINKTYEQIDKIKEAKGKRITEIGDGGPPPAKKEQEEKEQKEKSPSREEKKQESSHTLACEGVSPAKLVSTHPPRYHKAVGEAESTQNSVLESAQKLKGLLLPLAFVKSTNLDDIINFCYKKSSNKAEVTEQKSHNEENIIDYRAPYVTDKAKNNTLTFLYDNLKKGQLKVGGGAFEDGNKEHKHKLVQSVKALTGGILRKDPSLLPHLKAKFKLPRNPSKGLTLFHEAFTESYREVFLVKELSKDRIGLEYQEGDNIISSPTDISREDKVKAKLKKIDKWLDKMTPDKAYLAENLFVFGKNNKSVFYYLAQILDSSCIDKNCQKKAKLLLEKMFEKMHFFALHNNELYKDVYDKRQVAETEKNGASKFINYNLALVSSGYATDRHKTRDIFLQAFSDTNREKASISILRDMIGTSLKKAKKDFEERQKTIIVEDLLEKKESKTERQSSGGALAKTAPSISRRGSVLPDEEKGREESKTEISKVLEIGDKEEIKNSDFVPNDKIEFTGPESKEFTRIHKSVPSISSSSASVNNSNTSLPSPSISSFASIEGGTTPSKIKLQEVSPKENKQEQKIQYLYDCFDNTGAAGSEPEKTEWKLKSDLQLDDLESALVNTLSDVRDGVIESKHANSISFLKKLLYDKQESKEKALNEHKVIARGHSSVNIEKTSEEKLCKCYNDIFFIKAETSTISKSFFKAEYKVVVKKDINFKELVTKYAKKSSESFQERFQEFRNKYEKELPKEYEKKLEKEYEKKLEEELEKELQGSEVVKFSGEDREKYKKQLQEKYKTQLEKALKDGEKLLGEYRAKYEKESKFDRNILMIDEDGHSWMHYLAEAIKASKMFASKRNKDRYNTFEYPVTSLVNGIVSNMTDNKIITHEEGSSSTNKVLKFTNVIFKNDYDNLDSAFQSAFGHKIHDYFRIKQEEYIRKKEEEEIGRRSKYVSRIPRLTHCHQGDYSGRGVNLY